MGNTVFVADNKASFNVGAPWVLLTSDPDIVNLSVQTSIDELDDISSDYVLLSFQEGNLLSFTEKYSSSDGDGGKEANVTFKFLDPDMLIIPKLFRNTRAKIFQGLFQKLQEGMTPGASIYGADFRDLSFYGKTIKDYFGENGEDLTVDQQLALIARRVDPKTLEEILSDNSIKLYLSYGIGSDPAKQSPWRQIAITKFVMNQDSNDNATIDMVGVFPPQEIHEQGGLDEELTAEYVTGSKSSPLNRGSYMAAVPILKATTVNQRAANYTPIPPRRRDLTILGGRLLNDKRDVEFNNISLITTLLENLYQQYLINTSPSEPNYRPFIFLSPLVNVKFAKILGEQKNKLSEDERKLQDITFDLNIIANILEKCGILLVPGNVSKGIYQVSTNTRGYNADSEELIWYLALNREPFKRQGSFNPRAFVYESISELYSQLGITTVRMEGSQIINKRLSDAITTPLLNPTHKKAFIQQFCEPKDGQPDVYENRYGLSIKGETKKVSAGTVTRQRTANYRFLVQTPVEVEVFNYEDIYKVDLDSSNFDININEIEKYDIEVYSDAAITHYLITPICPSYSLEVLKVYEEEVLKNFAYANKNIDPLLRYSNAHKFLSNQSKDSSSYRQYLIKVANSLNLDKKGLGKDLLNIPDDYGVGLFSDLAPYLENIPVFIANRDNANVYEVVNQEKDLTYTTLLNSFSLFQGQALNSFTEIINGKDTSSLSLGPEDKLHELVEDVVTNSFSNNVTMVTMLQGIQSSLGTSEFSDTQDVKSLIASGVQNIIDVAKEAVKNANELTDKSIDYDELTMLMVYLQALSNLVSIINIKSDPFFQISFPFWIMKPCLFLNHTSFHALVTNRIPTRGFLSGIYMITGYEHTIDSGDCYSKFYLQRHSTGTDAISNLKINIEQ